MTIHKTKHTVSYYDHPFKHPEQTPNPIDQGANYLISVMAQGNPANVVAAVQQLTSQYDAKVAALMLDAAGKRIGQGQQYWAQAGQQWYVALQSVGMTPQRLGTQVQQIMRESAAPESTGATSA